MLEVKLASGTPTLGERVMMRHVPDPGFDPPPLIDIPQRRHDDVAVRDSRAPQRDLRPERMPIPCLAVPLEQLRPIVLCSCDPLHDLTAVARFLGGQRAHRRANDGFPLLAEHLAAAPVHLGQLHRAVVNDEDSVVDGIKHRPKPPFALAQQRMLCLLPRTQLIGLDQAPPEYLDRLRHDAKLVIARRFGHLHRKIMPREAPHRTRHCRQRDRDVARKQRPENPTHPQYGEQGGQQHHPRDHDVTCRRCGACERSIRIEAHALRQRGVSRVIERLSGGSSGPIASLPGERCAGQALPRFSVISPSVIERTHVAHIVGAGGDEASAVRACLVHPGGRAMQTLDGGGRFPIAGAHGDRHFRKAVLIESGAQLPQRALTRQPILVCQDYLLIDRIDAIQRDPAHDEQHEAKTAEGGADFWPISESASCARC